MTGDFRELVLGDVLIAPFVTYAILALVILILLRPLLTFVGFDRVLSNPPLGALCLYVIVLAALLVFS